MCKTALAVHTQGTKYYVSVYLMSIVLEGCTSGIGLTKHEALLDKMNKQMHEKGAPSSWWPKALAEWVAQPASALGIDAVLSRQLGHPLSPPGQHGCSRVAG